MADPLSSVTEQLRELRSVDYRVIAAIAAEAVELGTGLSDTVVDTIESAFATAGGPEQQVAYWYLIDKLCKQSELYIGVVKPRLLRLVKNYAPKADSPSWPLFEPLLKSFKYHFDGYLVALVENALGATGAAAGKPTSTAAVGQQQVPTVTTTVGPAGDSSPTTASGSGTGSSANRSSTALVAHSRQLRSLGAGFIQQQKGPSSRGEGKEHMLMVKSKDSLMAMRVGSTFAPAMPEEIAVPQHVADADAPQGYMQALPAGHTEEYVDRRRKRLREVMEKSRQQADAEEEARRAAQRTQQSVQAQLAHDDVIMPLDLPRDEYGVKRGFYPAGVRFLRDAIRECGGALELEVVVQRVATMAEREAVKEYGNIREFIEIHKPTFFVRLEHGKWVVRLTELEDDPIPYDSERDRFTWEEMQCPGCTRLLKGRNLMKHKNSRRCVGMQLGNGMRGIRRTPISELAYAAKVITDKLKDSAACEAEGNEDEYDDDDLFWFAECINRAGQERKFKLAAPHHFSPILVAIRMVRDAWLRRRSVVEMSDVEVSWEDRAFVAVFEAVGRNIRRLPISWIEVGDVIDMCRRFTSAVLPPFPPPPKGGDPRIRIHNDYPALLFAESDEDVEDDAVSGDDEMYSDDEAEAFEFAPPVTVSETMMIAGRKRDTMKLNYRLRTAPPMQLTKVLKGDRTQTLQTMYGEQQKQLAERAANQQQGYRFQGGYIQQQQQQPTATTGAPPTAARGAPAGPRVAKQESSTTKF